MKSATTYGNTVVSSALISTVASYVFFTTKAFSGLTGQENEKPLE